MSILKKPTLSINQIINMSVGFFGIQFAFALQNGNASRVLETFGAQVEHLSLFWLAAPITGMIVQPIIGYYSDKTWTKLGRRRPYFLFGAIFTAAALIMMPNSVMLAYILPPIVVGACMLTLMDASINVAMEPFRALVADKLPDEQRSLGFSVQTFLIGLGAIIGSLAPYLLGVLGVAQVAPEGIIPDNVKYAFYLGAALLIFCILWTIISTKEYPPMPEEEELENKEKSRFVFTEVLKDFSKMPKTMRQLGLVQFFSWFALFSMWVFTTPVIAQHIYHLPSSDTSSANFAKASNWVGVLFSVYNGVSAIYALLLPSLSKRFGKVKTHSFSLLAGGLGLLSILIIHNPTYLLISMVGVGFAWGSILAMPYAILSNAIPAKKMGVYMGIFNFFITLPQIINGFFGGLIVKYIYHGEVIGVIVLAGIFMVLGAVSVLKIKESKS